MDTAFNLPPAIAHYLVTLAAQQSDIAYLQVSPEGCILSSGGALKKYSLETAKVGDAIEQYLLFLAGFFPHPHDNEVMPYIQTEQGEAINVHFIAYSSNHTNGEHTNKETHSTANPTSAEQWILLLDAATELKQQQQFQQVANDLTLLRQQLTKQIDQAHHQVRSPIASPDDQQTNALIDQHKNNTPADDRTAQKVSILVIELCQSPFTITRLNNCFADITQLVLEESGLIHHIFGPHAVALFGLTPTSRSPAVQATRAAKRVLRQFTPQPQAQPTIATNVKIDQGPIVLSITTGEATIGTIHHTHRQTLNVNGPAVATSLATSNLPLEDLCHRLYHHSFIVDEPTLQASHTELSDFSTHPLRHHDHPPPLYQLIPKHPTQQQLKQSG